MIEKVVRAGIIPFYNDDGVIRMLFMKPADPTRGGPDWQCCKGRVEGDEGVDACAIREGREELGLLPANIKGDVVKLGVFLGRMHMYVCEVEYQELFGEPMDDETGDVKWLTLEEFEEEGRQLHLDIIRNAVRVIQSDFL